MSSGVRRSVERTLPCDSDAPRTARRLVDGLEVGGRARDDISLMVSEIVTNCVIHAQLSASDEIALLAVRTGDQVRVEIYDPGVGFAGIIDRTTQVGGWGLQIVDALADHWGTESGRRTCVWFEASV